MGCPSPPRQSCRELVAWQKAMDFVMNVYATTKVFSRDEFYGLAGQLSRAAVLIPTNIAEVKHTSRRKSFCSFLYEPKDHW
jgi:four helix bundle protein